MKTLPFRTHLAVITSALFCITAHAKQKHTIITPDKVISYKKTDTKDLKLNIFNPKDHTAEAQAPTIVLFFGGGWVGGSPRQFYAYAKKFAEAGYVAIAPDYRTKISPFTCVEDGKSAIRWVRAHAKELGIDPDRIIAGGGSAGGHVAACTGTIDGFEKGDNLKTSSKPNAMILYNPVIDTTEKGYGLGKVGRKRKTEVSPCHHVKKGIVPTIIFHGTADTTVPFENVERFTKLMKKSGNQCTLVPFKNKGHAFFNSKHFREKNTTKIFKSIMTSSLKFLNDLDFNKTK